MKIFSSNHQTNIQRAGQNSDSVGPLVRLLVTRFSVKVFKPVYTEGRQLLSLPTTFPDLIRSIRRRGRHSCLLFLCPFLSICVLTNLYFSICVLIFVFSQLQQQLPFSVWISCLQIPSLPFEQIGPYLYSDSNICDHFNIVISRIGVIHVQQGALLRCSLSIQP